MRSWCESAREPRRCTNSATPNSHWSRHDATGRHKVGGNAWRGHHTLGCRYTRASERSRVSAWGRRGAGERRVRPPREEQCGHAGVGAVGAREYRAPQPQQAHHAAWVPGGSTPSSGKVERKRRSWGGGVAGDHIAEGVGRGQRDRNADERFEREDCAWQDAGQMKSATSHAIEGGCLHPAGIAGGRWGRRRGPRGRHGGSPPPRHAYDH